MTSRSEILEVDKNYLCFSIFTITNADILRLILSYITSEIPDDEVPIFIKNIIPGDILEVYNIDDNSDCIRNLHWNFHVHIPTEYKGIKWNLHIRLIKYQRLNYIYHLMHKTLHIEYGEYETKTDFSEEDSDDPNAILPTITTFKAAVKKRFMLFEMLNHDDYIALLLSEGLPESFIKNIPAFTFEPWEDRHTQTHLPKNHKTGWDD